MTEIELETPDCPLCGSARRRCLYAGGVMERFAVCACEDCEMTYLAPRVTEDAMVALYQTDQYFTGDNVEGYSDYQTQELALRRTFRRLLEHLAARGKTGGSLLEVGCGFGYLLAEARPHFERTVGTDYSRAAVLQAQRYADQVFQGGVESVPSEARFDCVIATHVIEHVYQPKAFVRALASRLKPGGCLLIAAPDFGSFWRRLMGRRWPSFKLPEHVLYFNAVTLSRLMSECNLHQLEHVPYPHAFPLPLIASKFGVTLSASLTSYSLWLPATTIAYLGTVYE